MLREAKHLNLVITAFTRWIALTLGVRLASNTRNSFGEKREYLQPFSYRDEDASLCCNLSLLFTLIQQVHFISTFCVALIWEVLYCLVKVLKKEHKDPLLYLQNTLYNCSDIVHAYPPKSIYLSTELKYNFDALEYFHFLLLCTFYSSTFIWQLELPVTSHISHIGLQNRWSSYKIWRTVID